MAYVRRSDTAQVSDAPDTSDARPAFSSGFALLALILVAAIGMVTLVGLVTLVGRLGLATGWDTFGSRFKIAAVMGFPGLILGAIVVLIGIWMALVEWRGRFARTADEDPRASSIEARPRLRGAALVLLAGVALMLTSAWITQAAVGPAPTTVVPAGAP